MNLPRPGYVGIICGSLDRLAHAFAEIDAANRSRSIAAGVSHNHTAMETASLSTRDKRIARMPAMGDRIVAAAQCV